MMSKDFMPKAFMPKVFVLEKTFNSFRSTGASAAGQAIFGAFFIARAWFFTRSGRDQYSYSS